MIYGQFIPLQCYFLLKITIILPIIFISYLSFLTFPIIEFNHFLAYIYLLIQFTFTILIILLKIVPFGHSSLQKLFIHIMLVLKLLHLLGIIFQFFGAILSFFNHFHLLLQSLRIAEFIAYEIIYRVLFKSHAAIQNGKNYYQNRDIMRLIVVVILILLATLVQPRRRRMGMSRMGARGVSTIGNGLASLVKQIKSGQQSDDAVLISGKDVNEPINTHRIQQEVASSFLDWVIYTVVSFFGIAGLLYCIYRNNQNRDDRPDWQGIRERQDERQRKMDILNSVNSHGVHPDRASGKIYKIRL